MRQYYKLESKDVREFIERLYRSCRLKNVGLVITCLRNFGGDWRANSIATSINYETYVSSCTSFIELPVMKINVLEDGIELIDFHNSKIGKIDAEEVSITVVL